MTVLVPTLRSLLDHADALFSAGRVQAARAAYEELLERAQEKTDRSTEAIARTMLARCLLWRKDFDGARDAWQEAGLRLPKEHPEAVWRHRATQARLAVADAARDGGDPREAQADLRDYLDSARAAGAWREAIDACFLLCEGAKLEDRLAWLQLATDIGSEHSVDSLLGRAWHDLATVLEQLERQDAALDAWENAYTYYKRTGTTRQVVSAAWAAGSLACRVEDWPLAQTRLEQAIAAAEATDDCGDLLALALADVARVHDSAGDVIEARRVMLRAIAMAREYDLARDWPERWDGLRLQAKALDLDM